MTELTEWNNAVNATDADKPTRGQEKEEDNKGLLCKILYYWWSPLTYEFCHSIGCLVFQFYQFFAALALGIFTAVTLGVSVPLVVVACIGLLLIWIFLEIILVLSHIDFVITRGLVERECDIDPLRAHLLDDLCVYKGVRPLPACICSDVSGCFGMMFSRAKNLYMSCNMLSIIIYHIIIRPITFLLSGWTIIFPLYFIYMITLPICYAIPFLRDHWFAKNQVCMFGASITWNHHHHSSSDSIDNNVGGDDIFDFNNMMSTTDYNNDIATCYGWTINSLGMCFLALFVGLLLLPIALRLNNFGSKFALKAARLFYTYYYTDNEDIIKGKTGLLDINEHKSYTDNQTRIPAVTEDMLEEV